MYIITSDNKVLLQIKHKYTLKTYKKRNLEPQGFTFEKASKNLNNSAQYDFSAESSNLIIFHLMIFNSAFAIIIKLCYNKYTK